MEKQTLAIEDSILQYNQAVQAIDQGVGKIMGALVDTGQLENTIVIFTSDNGGLDGNGRPTENAPLRSGKGFPSRARRSASTTCM